MFKLKNDYQKKDRKKNKQQSKKYFTKSFARLANSSLNHTSRGFKKNNSTPKEKSGKLRKAAKTTKMKWTFGLGFLMKSSLSWYGLECFRRSEAK